MNSVLPAETAVFFQFKAVRSILAVLFGVVIALFAFGAGKHNIGACVFRCHFENTSFIRSSRAGRTGPGKKQ
jgi:hypothetical protein